MRLAKLFGQTLRTTPADAETSAHQLALRAGLVRPLQSGSLAMLPLGMRVVRQIECVIHEELAAIGAQELRTPVIQAAAIWQKTGRYEQYGPAMLRFADRAGRSLLFAPTHEETIAYLAASEIASYRQLPALVYQIHTKYRDELRARGGLLRLREFSMLDAYSLDADQGSMDSTYTQVGLAFARILGRCGIAFVTAVADGGEMGGSETTEYHVLSAAGEDTLLVCGTCGYAVNTEVTIAHGQQNECPRCGTQLEQQPGIEIGHIFKFGTRYAEALGAQFLDHTGRMQPIMMGSYGIGIERLLHVILEQHHDNQGIIWPAEVTPFDIHLVYVGRTEAGRLQAEQIYTELSAARLRVLFDDRSESAGIKFADADVIGVPIRVLSNDRLSGAGLVEIKRRHDGEVRQLKREELVAAIRLSVPLPA
jgi:prolyl-tRNA synthetase